MINKQLAVAGFVSIYNTDNSYLHYRGDLRLCRLSNPAAHLVIKMSLKCKSQQKERQVCRSLVSVLLWYEFVYLLCSHMTVYRGMYNMSVGP